MMIERHFGITDMNGYSDNPEMVLTLQSQNPANHAKNTEYSITKMNGNKEELHFSINAMNGIV